MKTLHLIFLTAILLPVAMVAQRRDKLHGNPFLSATDSKATVTQFTLSSNSETVSIEWTTSEELRNEYFTVEMSIDGFEWHQVGAQKAAGTSKSVHYYKMEDMQPHYGDSYYRLYYTDKFGVSEMVGEETVFHDGNENISENGLPNAVKKGSIIQMQNFNVLSGINQINIMSEEGEVVHTQYLTENELHSDVNLQIPNNLKTGVYELRVIGMDNLISYTQLISVY